MAIVVLKYFPSDVRPQCMEKHNRGEAVSLPGSPFPASYAGNGTVEGSGWISSGDSQSASSQKYPSNPCRSADP